MIFTFPPFLEAKRGHCIYTKVNLGVKENIRDTKYIYPEQVDTPNLLSSNRWDTSLHMETRKLLSLLSLFKSDHDQDEGQWFTKNRLEKLSQ